ncbi:GL11187 [Drosophila persimilis]|uniref:GL11187 n=1 Tax=Drosophila persimilis TaxID=7234 RepID=B4GD02_DROPE|nr:GL11187 [Drosophila persimilis]
MTISSRVQNLNQSYISEEIFLQGGHRFQKDPYELSLKERMKLFETGNNKTIIPKAPIASEASVTHFSAVHPVPAAAVSSIEAAESAVAAQKPKPENKLCAKVAALVSNAESIKHIDWQRQEDMKTIPNRFKMHKEIFVTQAVARATPPPASVPAIVSMVIRPMPPPMSGLCPALARSKRRSDYCTEDSMNM